jgi:hypothetical protein
MIRRFLFPLFALAVLFLNGCAGYKLGSTLPSDIRTIYVPTCLNQTDEPLIEINVTRGVVSEIQMDGTLKLVNTEAEADAVLEITLLKFWINPVSYASDSASTPNAYRMNIKASFYLRRVRDNVVLVESPSLTGWAEFSMTGDMTTAKSVALRPAAEDLGERIVANVTEVW